MTEQTVNIPLLRKAVEWAEAEAAKPPELCEWEQGVWVQTDPHMIDPERADRMGLSSFRSPSCGTCYCIAGYTAQVLVGDTSAFNRYTEVVASEALGLSEKDADTLFDCDNSIADVRRIAEDIAGERL